MKKAAQLQLSYLDEEEGADDQPRSNYIDSEFTQLVDNFLLFEKNNLVIDKHGFTYRGARFVFPLQSELVTVRPLGKGSSAKVYLVATRSDPTVQFALKTFNGYDKSSRIQFLNDIEHYKDAKNRSPFIVGFHGAYYEAPNVQLILEYVEGGSVKQYIEAGRLQAKKIPEKVVRKVVEGLLHGLVFIHNVIKRIHLDLKPENVLLTPGLDAKISDFGVSKPLDFTNQNIENFAGTYLYMSPERLLNREFGAVSDVWSLGVIMYEMMLLEYPFPDQKSYIDLMQFLNRRQNLVDETVLRQNYSALSLDFLRACLEVDPDSRPRALELIGHPWLYQLGP